MSGADASVGPLGIIAAGGAMPFAVADALRSKNRSVVVFGLEGICDPVAIKDFPHHWVAAAKLGHLFRLLKAENVRDLVMIGAMTRPSISEMWPDWTTLKLLPSYMAALRGGDDHLLVRVGRMFEDHGFRMLGLQDVAPEILMPQGQLTRAMPDAEAQADIAIGQAVLSALSPYDVGQAVVVIDRHVVGVEGIEGTDALLARIAQMRVEGRIRYKPGRGVLIKAPKVGQDLRFDLPTVGPNTVDGVSRAGLAGMAVTEGRAIAAEAQRMIAAADRDGLFIVGTAP